MDTQVGSSGARVFPEALSMYLTSLWPPSHLPLRGRQGTENSGPFKSLGPEARMGEAVFRQCSASLPHTA